MPLTRKDSSIALSAYELIIAAAKCYIEAHGVRTDTILRPLVTESSINCRVVLTGPTVPALGTPLLSSLTLRRKPPLGGRLERCAGPELTASDWITTNGPWNK